MARSHAKIHVTIWDDPSWVALTGGAQRLYKLLLTQKKLTLIGLLTYTPSRWARLAADTTLASVEGDIDELEASRFVHVDRDTDELLIRTMVKNDVDNLRLLDNVNLMRGLWNAWTAIESHLLRHIAAANIPARVWDSPKAKPPAEALTLRAQPVRTPSSTPLERPVQTTQSDQPSEPVVPTSLRPSPFALPDDKFSLAAETHHKSPAPDPAAAVDNGTQLAALTDADRQDRLADAIELLVDRELQRNPTKGSSVARHRVGVRRGKLRDHHEAGHRHLRATPTLTPQALADLLEPPPAPPPGREPARTNADGTPFVPGTGPAPGWTGPDRTPDALARAGIDEARDAARAGIAGRQDPAS